MMVILQREIMSIKFIEPNLVTNSYNLENAIAQSVFLANVNRKKIGIYDNDNFLLVRPELSPISISAFHEDKEIESTPVIVVFDKKKFNKFFKGHLQNYENNLGLIQFIPIYLIKEIFFKDESDYENYLATKYANLNKDLFKTSFSPELFSENIQEEYVIDSDELPEVKIPASKLETFDSILGGIQSALYLSKQSQLGNPERYFKIIQGMLIDKSNSESVEWFGFDINATLQNGIKSISQEDSLAIKIFKATLIKLSSEAYTENMISLTFIQSIFSSLPRIIFTNDEELQIEKFIQFCDDTSSGKLSVKHPEELNELSTVEQALVLLLTQSGKNQIDEIISQANMLEISDEVLFTSILFFGFYRNYSSLSLAFKEKKSFQPSISLLTGIFLLNKGRVEIKQDVAPNGLSSWWDLSIDSEIFARVDTQDVFLGSVSSQALRAGYNFKSLDPETLVLRKIREDDTDLTLKKLDDNFFEMHTDILLDASNKKITKLKILEILEKMEEKTIRSSIVARNKEIFLRQTQLSSTLDHDEIKTMIEGLYSDWQNLSEFLKSI